MQKRERASLLKQAMQDDKLQAVLRKKCSEDWKFFINTFCWTYDPRLNNPHLPFILYPKQEELIAFFEKMLAKSRKGESVAVIIDKPRDVGATFTTMVWGLWHFLFDEFSFRVGSRKEDYVDKKGDVDTLFFKVDYNLRRMPDFLLPKGFKFKNHRGALMLMNPENSNAITGESANPNFGRGGRKSAILFDELGFWDWSRASWESAGESTNLRIAMSTPPESGKDSQFYKLCIGERGRVYKFNFEWVDVPTRDQSWLKEKKENKSEAEFAREVMKSYEGTTEGKVYASDMKYVKLSEVDYDPNLPLYVTWDVGLDATSLIWIQKNEEGKLKIIDCYENYNKEIGFFAPFVTGDIISGYDYSEYDLEVIHRHQNWTDMIFHYGDPSVKHRSDQNGISTRDLLQDKYGIYIESKDWGNRTWLDLRDQTKPLFRRMEMNEKRCEYLISCLRSARYPRRTENSQNTSGSRKPIHDWTCITGDTMVRTLQGWYRIDELVDKDFYVWSYSHQEKRLIPTKANKCWKSGFNVKLIEVEIDSGEKIKCTPEHRFMLRNGSYKRADDLQKEDSLMPFYEHESRGYRRINLNDGSTAEEHRYVYSRLKSYIPKNLVIDHIDENKTNNNPENLQLLTVVEHCKKSKSWKKLKDSSFEKRAKNRSAKNSIRKCPVCGEKKIINYKAIYCSKECRLQAQLLRKKTDRLIKAEKRKCVVCKKEYWGYKRDKTCSKECADARKKRYNILYGRKYRRGDRITMEQSDGLNHKVISIKTLQEREDVYDIDVPETHNFVANGVIIHNSHYRSALEYFADNEPGYIPAVSNHQRPIFQNEETFTNENEKYYII